MIRPTSFAAVALFASLAIVSGVRAQNPLPSAIPPVDGIKSPAPAATQQPGESQSTASQPPEQNDAERLKLWNSPEMTEARAWLKLYFSRAKAITPEQAQTYMSRLEQLPAPQMTEWLGRYRLERQRAAASQATVERARQLSVEAALQAQQQMQKGYANINRREGAAGKGAASGIDAQRQLANARSLQNAQSRDATVIANTPGAAFNTGPYYLAFPPYAPYFAAATNPFPDGINPADPSEARDAADIERSTREP